jgi:hypothetical protein
VRPDLANFLATLVFFGVLGIPLAVICFWPSRKRDL